jgi:hypothetical protein
LIETLNNSFARFHQLGICDLIQYEKSEGPPVDFIKCPIDRKPKIDKYFSVLEALSSCANNKEKTKIVEIEI